MKKLILNKFSSCLLLVLLISYQHGLAQEDTAGQKITRVRYYNSNNSMQYLLLESTLKKNKVLTAQKNKVYQVYLDNTGPGSLIGTVTTGEDGSAKIFIPVSLKAAWDSSGKHSFIVKEGDVTVIDDYAVTKARIKIDTVISDGVRSITVNVLKYENKEWVPAKDVEMKVGVERLGSILSAGDEETYTTDSTGSVSVEMKKDSLPGDKKGLITLAAKVEDNDELGNLFAEKSVPWGTPTNIKTDFFDQRTLWSTRFHTPYWLLFMAYSIVFAVWGTLIYLLFQLGRIKKLGA